MTNVNRLQQRNAEAAREKVSCPVSETSKKEAFDIVSRYSHAPGSDQTTMINVIAEALDKAYNEGMESAETFARLEKMRTEIRA